MITLPVYNQKGENVGNIDVPEFIFGLEPNHTLLHQVYVAQCANIRRPTAHTKDRSARSGSGRKPWKQKGTGRARAGSVRSPIWRKGGVTFGPTNERNYQQKVNSRMKKKALALALSEKVRSSALFVVDTFVFDNLKTKSFVDMLRQLKIKGSTVAGFGTNDKHARRISRNIAGISPVLATDMNVKNLLESASVLLSKDSLGELSKIFRGAKE